MCIKNVLCFVKFKKKIFITKCIIQGFKKFKISYLVKNTVTSLT